MNYRDSASFVVKFCLLVGVSLYGMEKDSKQKSLSDVLLSAFSNDKISQFEFCQTALKNCNILLAKNNDASFNECALNFKSKIEQEIGQQIDINIVDSLEIDAFKKSILKNKKRIYNEIKFNLEASHRDLNNLDVNRWTLNRGCLNTIDILHTVGRMGEFIFKHCEEKDNDLKKYDLKEYDNNYKAEIINDLFGYINKLRKYESRNDLKVIAHYCVLFTQIFNVLSKYNNENGLLNNKIYSFEQIAAVEKHINKCSKKIIYFPAFFIQYITSDDETVSYDSAEDFIDWFQYFSSKCLNNHTFVAICQLVISAIEQNEDIINKKHEPFRISMEVAYAQEVISKLDELLSIGSNEVILFNNRFLEKFGEIEQDLASKKYKKNAVVDKDQVAKKGDRLKQIKKDLEHKEGLIKKYSAEQFKRENAVRYDCNKLVSNINNMLQLLPKEEGIFSKMDKSLQPISLFRKLTNHVYSLCDLISQCSIVTLIERELGISMYKINVSPIQEATNTNFLLFFCARPELVEGFSLSARRKSFNKFRTSAVNIKIRLLLLLIAYPEFALLKKTMLF